MLTGDDMSRLCSDAISKAERTGNIPTHLLSAIASVESGRWDRARRSRVAWPWTINAEGEGHFFPTKSAAILAVRQLQAEGVESIDVGCMQINLRHHPNAFDDLNEAFDPAANVAYAAKFLRSLYQEAGSWPQAAMRYHSATPGIGAPYRDRVMALWNQRQGTEGTGEGEDQAVAAPEQPPRFERYFPGQPTNRVRSERLAMLRTPAEAAGASDSGAPIRFRNPWFRSPSAQSSAAVSIVRGQTAGRDAAGEAAFADKRQQVLKVWRDSRRTSVPVTVLRGSDGPSTRVAVR
jgi:hypothetical protein